MNPCSSECVNKLCHAESLCCFYCCGQCQTCHLWLKTVHVAEFHRAFTAQIHHCCAFSLGTFLKNTLFIKLDVLIQHYYFLLHFSLTNFRQKKKLRSFLKMENPQMK